MPQPDANSRHLLSTARKLAIAAVDGRDRGHARPAAARRRGPGAGAATAGTRTGDPRCRHAPAARTAIPAPPPPADPNAPPPPPADPERAASAAGRPERAAARPERATRRRHRSPGRVNNAPAKGFSYLLPEGWKVADATQLSYGQALLTKIPPPGTEQPPNDTSVLLGRLARHEALRRFGKPTTPRLPPGWPPIWASSSCRSRGPASARRPTPLDPAGDLTGTASYYEVKFTDTTKPTGQIWAGVVGLPPGGGRISRPARTRALVCGVARDGQQPGRQGRRRPRWRSRSGRGRRRHRRHRHRRRTRTPRRTPTRRRRIPNAPPASARRRRPGTR